MNIDILADAIGQINDKYIVGAKNNKICIVVGDQESSGNITHHRRGRKVFIYIAAVIVFVLASFVTAMAISEEFRETVFSVFHIETIEVIPSSGGNPDMNTTIEHISEVDIDGKVGVNYFKVNGVIQENNGLIYSSQYNGTDAGFFDVTADGLKEIPKTRVDFLYNFRGTHFNIKFDYTIYNDKLHYNVLPDSLDLDPYKYGWNIYIAGSSIDQVWLVLPYSVNKDYSLYPLLLDLKTQEITDVFEDISLEDVVVDRWQFTDDMAYALVWGHSEDPIEKFWLCDISQKTITPMAELTGKIINNCYILKDNLIILYVVDGENFDVINYDITTGDEISIAEDVQHYGLTDDGSGFRPIEYNGRQGQHALLFDDEKDITLINLVTGSRIPLTGLKNDGTLITSESPDGKHIMIALSDSDYSGSLALYEIGVLDTQTGVLTMLERENYEVKTEDIVGWLDDEHIAVVAHDENDECYLYVYSFM